VINLNGRVLSSEESSCADRCTEKNFNVNHKILSAFVVEQPKVQEKKLEAAAKEAEAAMQRMREEGKELNPDEMAAKMLDAMPKASVPNPQA